VKTGRDNIAERARARSCPCVRRPSRSPTSASASAHGKLRARRSTRMGSEELIVQQRGRAEDRGRVDRVQGCADEISSRNNLERRGPAVARRAGLHASNYKADLQRQLLMLRAGTSCGAEDSESTTKTCARATIDAAQSEAVRAVRLATSFIKAADPPRAAARRGPRQRRAEGDGARPRAARSSPKGPADIVRGRARRRHRRRAGWSSAAACQPEWEQTVSRWRRATSRSSWNARRRGVPVTDIKESELKGFAD